MNWRIFFSVWRKIVITKSIILTHLNLKLQLSWHVRSFCGISRTLFGTPDYKRKKLDFHHCQIYKLDTWRRPWPQPPWNSFDKSAWWIQENQDSFSKCTWFLKSDDEIRRSCEVSIFRKNTRNKAKIFPKCQLTKL